MPKAKITIQVEVEFNMVPKHYQTGSTSQQMLEQDLKSVKEDPYILMDSENAKWNITGELINEKTD